MKQLKLILNLFLLIVFIILGLFVAGYFNLITFFKPFVVLSGSMDPSIQTGSVVFVLPQPYGYQLGDVITYLPTAKGTPVTHRIHALKPRGLYVDYETKGDANKNSDNNQISYDQIIGKVNFWVPYIGYIANFTKTPKGFIFLVIIPATIVVYEELKSIYLELQKVWLWLKRRRHRRSKIQSIQQVLHDSSKQLTVSKSINQKFAFIPFLSALFVTISLSNSFLSDTTASQTNQVGAATNFGEKITNLYQSTTFDCEHGATDTANPKGKAIFKLVDNKINLDLIVSGATANTDFNLFFNQYPVGCPTITPTTTFSTDPEGNHTLHLETDKIASASAVWISIEPTASSSAAPTLSTPAIEL